MEYEGYENFEYHGERRRIDILECTKCVITFDMIILILLYSFKIIDSICNWGLDKKIDKISDIVIILIIGSGILLLFDCVVDLHYTNRCLDWIYDRRL